MKKATLTGLRVALVLGILCTFVPAFAQAPAPAAHRLSPSPRRQQTSAAAVPLPLARLQYERRCLRTRPPSADQAKAGLRNCFARQKDINDGDTDWLD